MSQTDLADNHSDDATQPVEMELDVPSHKGHTAVDDNDGENNEGVVSSDASDADEIETTFVQTENNANGNGVSDTAPMDTSKGSTPADHVDQTENNEEDTSDLPPRPEDPEKERAIIKELLSSSKLKLGETWYVISSRWLRSWKQFVNYDGYAYYQGARPGVIDNSELVEEGSTTLRRNLSEDYHYDVIPSRVWKIFHFWYTGGPALPRKVISSGRSGTLVVEVRPLNLKIIRSTTPTVELPVQFSKVCTIGDFKEAVCKRLQLDPANVRLWDYHGRQKIKQLSDMRETLDEAQIIDNQYVLFEEKNADGTWPPDTTGMVTATTTYRSGTSYYDSYYSSYYGNAEAPGLVGLGNLGNTCFLNSALQCLSNTPPLVDFFISGQYRSDINRENPLGQKGELAEEFATLMRQIWQASPPRAIHPRDFKWRLERFAPQFGGYQQHDSQELLAYLLDGLHEDLNRIRNKPYVATTESDGRPDVIVAAEAWAGHKARNDSRVVDWFQGQLKSTLVCPVCEKISITFDPFMYLSLPLPVKGTRVMTATVWWRDGNRRPIKYAVEIDKNARVAEFRRKLEQLSGIGRLHVTEVLRGRYMRHFTDTDLVDSIQPNDIIFAYEVGVPLVEPRAANVVDKVSAVSTVDTAAGGTDGQTTVTADSSTAGSTSTSSTATPPPAEDEPYIALPVLQRKEDTYYSYAGRMVLHGLPYVISVKSSYTYKQVYDEVARTICRFIKVPIPPLGTSGADPMFRLSVVDPTGTTEVQPLVDDDKPLGLDATQTLAINWANHVLPRVYKQDEEGNIETHSSVRRGGRDDDDNDELSSVSLSECLNLFTTIETLGPEDPWYCNRCREHRQATKKFDLWRLPPVLVVHLKRFSYKNRYYVRDKLETFVDYPLTNLDLSPWVIAPGNVPGEGEDPQPPPVYDLFAVSNHYGSLVGGHYTAYAKNRITGKWYKFDDSYVSEISEGAVKTSAAYVLFYLRRGAYSAAPPAVAAADTTTTAGSLAGPAGVAAHDVAASTTTVTTTMTNAHTNGREEGEDDESQVTHMHEVTRMPTTDLHLMRRQHYGSESDNDSSDDDEDGTVHNVDDPRERVVHTRLPDSDDSEGDESDPGGITLHT